VRIGAHVSTSGGAHTAIGRALEIGANCIQIFAGAPQRWAEAKFSAEDVESFRELSLEKDVTPAFIHSSYLLNFASTDESLREKSVQSLLSALRWADRLGAVGVITHLGSSRDTDPEQALESVCGCLDLVLQEAPERPQLLMESCAGQGNTIGRRFEQLGAILRNRKADQRLQVCVDTAHIFEAGYDITTAEGLDTTLREFDETVGLDRLKALHVNDSKTPLGSNVDRHENIGFGEIGEDAFARILRHPRLRPLPFLLEVPGMTKEGPDRPNINALRRLAGVEDA
jgi:deoxyribonuclease IV